jgi:hypothetical protein
MFLVLTYFPQACLFPTSNKERGDPLIRAFWSRGTNIMVDIRVTWTASKLYRSSNHHKVLATQEHKKKKKYLQACLKHCKHFILMTHQWFDWARSRRVQKSWEVQPEGHQNGTRYQQSLQMQQSNKGVLKQSSVGQN